MCASLTTEVVEETEGLENLWLHLAFYNVCGKSCVTMMQFKAPSLTVPRETRKCRVCHRAAAARQSGCDYMTMTGRLLLERAAGTQRRKLITPMTRGKEKKIKKAGTLEELVRQQKKKETTCSTGCLVQAIHVPAVTTPTSWIYPPVTVLLP